MKPRAEHLLFLDYFRGVAILSVFFFHSFGVSFQMFELPWVDWFRGWDVDKSLFFVFPVVFGGNGVALFFAVSGFCIHLSHQRHRQQNYTVFFIRRFFRIYPPYLLALLFFAFLFPVTRLAFDPKSPHPAGPWSRMEDIVSHLLLIHNLSNRFFFSINGAFWSVAVEAQLYLLYPILRWLATRLGWQGALGIAALIELSMRGFLSLLVITHSSLFVSHYYTGSPFFYWFSWAVGAVLADAYLKGDPLPYRNVLSFLWPVLMVGFYFFSPLDVFIFPLAALSTTCLMSYCLSRPAWKSPREGWRKHALNHLRWTGIVSYSFYLLHQPFLYGAHYVFTFIFHHSSSPPLVLFGICLCCWLPLFGLSYLFYRYVEQPSIAWGKRIIEQIRE